jgi:hypothetical protein
MTRANRREATALLQRLLALLLQASNGAASGEKAADFRRAVGALSANASERISGWGFGSELAACFGAATTAGGSLDGFERVLAAAQAENPLGAAGKAVATAFVRLSLVEMSVVLSRSIFASRDEMEAKLRKADDLFVSAEEYAADQGEDSAYRALVSLHAAVVRDMNQRGRPLPRIVRYSFSASRPAVVLANRFYADAGRADEIVAENAVFHPLFAGRTIKALSA